jgi:hypothetical protein
MPRTTRDLALLFVTVLPLAAAPAAVAEEVGPKAVVAESAMKACNAAANTPAAKACLKAALPKVSPEAARFARRLNDDGYLSAFMETGRVDVATVTYVFRGNATTGTLLVNGIPALVDVNAPDHYKAIDIKKDPLYAKLAKEGEVELWADDPGRPLAESTPEGGQRFTFSLPIKSCHACAPVGTAVVAFDFDVAGHLTGVRLVKVSEGWSGPS